MPSKNKQAEAANHIRGLLMQRGLDIKSHRLTLPDNQQWVILEHEGRQVGIDSASGVWVRASIRHDWRCVAMPCTVSSALQALEFLVESL
jgi:hypothetical protein